MFNRMNEVDPYGTFVFRLDWAVKNFFADDGAANERECQVVNDLIEALFDLDPYAREFCD